MEEDSWQAGQAACSTASKHGQPKPAQPSNEQPAQPSNEQAAATSKQPAQPSNEQAVATSKQPAQPKLRHPPGLPHLAQPRASIDRQTGLPFKRLDSTGLGFEAAEGEARGSEHEATGQEHEATAEAKAAAAAPAEATSTTTTAEAKAAGAALLKKGLRELEQKKQEWWNA